MTFNFPKKLMVLLICVAFFGQAMASTVMSYNMASYNMASYHMLGMKGMNDQAQSQSMPRMDHSNHNMISDSSAHVDKSAEKATEDCCTKTCNSCFTGGCSSVAVLMKGAITRSAIVDISSKIISYSSLALSQQPTSLYRPPILS